MELRWLMRFDTRHDPHEGHYYLPATVLQFRIYERGRLPDNSDGWSEWKDVPTVNELTTEARGSDL